MCVCAGAYIEVFIVVFDPVVDSGHRACDVLHDVGLGDVNSMKCDDRCAFFD
jgi:hypothetical protein